LPQIAISSYDGAVSQWSDKRLPPTKTVHARRKGDGMIQYSCDRCKCSIDAEEDLRYVVKMEVHATMDSPGCEESDLDRDNLLEIHEILERLEDSESEAIADDVYQRRRFDLCADCYRKFMASPVGADAAARAFGFSEN
jgi:hypothetical protein